MNDQKPITGQELGEMKGMVEQNAQLALRIVAGSEKGDDDVEAIARAKQNILGICDCFPRCLTEIERLRAGLEKIEARLSLDESKARMRDGGPLFSALLTVRSL